MKFGDFPKIYLELILWIFFSKHELDFTVPAISFFFISSVGIMNISLAILVVFESRGFRKNFSLLNDTFSTDTVIINLGNYIRRI